MAEGQPKVGGFRIKYSSGINLLAAFVRTELTTAAISSCLRRHGSRI